jgi:hypothetical protein
MSEGKESEEVRSAKDFEGEDSLSPLMLFCRKVLLAFPRDGYWLIGGFCVGIFVPIFKLWPDHAKIIFIVSGLIIAGYAYICNLIERKIFSQPVSNGFPVAYIQSNINLIFSKSNCFLLLVLAFFSSKYIFLTGALIAQSFLLILRIYK